MRKIWAEEGWSDYLYWQEQDKRTLRKIHRLICSIDDKNRLVYRILGDCVEILGFRGHYGDK